MPYPTKREKETWNIIFKHILGIFPAGIIACWAPSTWMVSHKLLVGLGDPEHIEGWFGKGRVVVGGGEGSE